MVRATASGQTTAISPYGRITAMLEPFTQGYLCPEVPVYDVHPATVYMLWGDVTGVICTVVSALLLIIGTVKTILRRRKTA